jgi:hypothetical protein
VLFTCARFRIVSTQQSYRVNHLKRYHFQDAGRIFCNSCSLLF